MGNKKKTLINKVKKTKDMSKKKVEESVIDKLLKINDLSADELMRYKHDIILDAEGKQIYEPK